VWVTPHHTNKNHGTNKKQFEPDRKGSMAQADYFERKLDDKRRLTIPAELRAEFAGGVVITRGFSNYLHIYPQNVWDQDVEPALAGSILDEKTADLNVQFRTGKVSAELDAKQGRITIEQHLLDYAGINRGVVCVRAGKYWRLMAS
jgi:MraZ protein